MGLQFHFSQFYFSLFQKSGVQGGWLFWGLQSGGDQRFFGSAEFRLADPEDSDIIWKGNRFNPRVLGGLFARRDTDVADSRWRSKGLLEGGRRSMGGAKGPLFSVDVLPFCFRGLLNRAIISKPVILPSARNPSITPYQWDRTASAWW